MATKISRVNLSRRGENNQKRENNGTTTLDVSSSCLFALDGLNEYICLKRLLAYDNCLSDVECLQSLHQLEVVHLQHNNVRKIENAFTDCAALKELRLDFNCISKVSSLTFEKCENLTVLDLSFNQLQSIEFLQKLPSLRELYLSNNQVESITPLMFCKNLTDLDLTANKIVEAKEGLSGLSSLQSVNLSRNKISSLFGLNKLPHVTTFNISGNKLDSAACIALACPSIEYFDLSENMIRNADDILMIVDYLKELKEFNIQNNPLDFSTTTYDRRSFMREIQGKVPTVQRVQLARSGKNDSKKKVFTLQDVGQEIVGAMEDQFTTLSALADIYNTRISERYARLKDAFSGIPAPKPWSTGVEVNADDDELTSGTRHGPQNVRTRLYEALRFSRNAEETTTETVENLQEAILT
uniref:Protein phosphatase 1 regulatory subunit 7 n=3 Tax=Schistocephalus solidus TaxID=70667 RepID=A0A0X3PR34_SCHSO